MPSPFRLLQELDMRAFFSSPKRRDPDAGPPAEESPALRMRVSGRRRAVLVRTAVWAALAAGPLALAVSCAVPHGVVRTRPAPAASGAGDRAAQSVVDPSGSAQVFLALWLRAGSSGDAAAVAALRSMAPSVAVPVWGEHAPAVERVVAVRAVQVSGAAWSVTVAAEFRASAQPSPGGVASAVRYFAVPLVVSQGKPKTGVVPGVTVTAAPAEVAAPAAAKDGPSLDSLYGAEVSAGSPLAVAAGEFLAAYASGASGAERYLAPGVTLPALVPAPYAGVSVERISADGHGDGAVAADGSRVRLRVQVSARDAAGGQWPLTYALELSARQGRWEVAALQSGLEPAGSRAVGGGQR
ncbi:conjugal transfer protein [Streptomyces sp. WM6378]|uniref:conjugal transfer protein n=1 Tax=Streptomyces sp. WM6378 TaxID=1415557 RepID=UPI0006ADF48B|nr:conjugal transfer protein [Streptomyces sp. WM6378]